jgi:hypothetical protein
LGEKVCTGHYKSTKITIFLTTIDPRDLEFDPIWLCDMPKCSVDTDGHILGIMGPIWRKILQRTAQIHQNHYILTTIGPRDLEFHPIWLYDMPKCFVYTDGHILGIMGPIWN